MDNFSLLLSSLIFTPVKWFFFVEEMKSITFPNFVFGYLSVSQLVHFLDSQFLPQIFLSKNDHFNMEADYLLY